ncbi:hypothetical protein B0T16DRAFT_455971 [Cercophora newfieldiana]|uniref:Uncharacterized protein n=1 Tax=Cercophora newfieldiana TaxID=92897 RepID=A0AA40CTH9_9PEZI|nr:hypothetical protein B0T16DRAFT_455971 [Cercophora newfieldiana]
MEFWNNLASNIAVGLIVAWGPWVLWLLLWLVVWGGRCAWWGLGVIFSWCGKKWREWKRRKGGWKRMGVGHVPAGDVYGPVELIDLGGRRGGSGGGSGGGGGEGEGEEGREGVRGEEREEGREEEVTAAAAVGPRPRGGMFWRAAALFCAEAKEGSANFAERMEKLEEWFLERAVGP